MEKSLRYLDQCSRNDYADKRKDDVPNGASLRAINPFLSVVFSSYDETLREKVKQCFKVHIERHKKKRIKRMSNHLTTWNGIKYIFGDSVQYLGKSIGRLFCYFIIMSIFNFRIQNLLKIARNLIMASGTLSPLDSLIAEMEIANPIKHISKHVIQPKQVYIKVVNRGPDGELLNSCYNNR